MTNYIQGHAHYCEQCKMHVQTMLVSGNEVCPKCLVSIHADGLEALAKVLSTKEVDPNGLANSTPGAKVDAGKEPAHRGLHGYFPRALLAVSMVSGFGAGKYSWGGWKHVEDGINRYNDAHERHVLKKEIEGTYDSDGQRHQAQVAWNALAVLELELIEEERSSVESIPKP